MAQSPVIESDLEVPISGIPLVVQRLRKGGGPNCGALLSITAIATPTEGCASGVMV